MQTADMSSSHEAASASATASQPAGAGVDDSQRWQMIAEAAYFIAEHRGFDGGDPLQDWLAAEAEIDRQLSISALQNPEQAAAYARLRDEVGKAFAQLQDTVDAAAMKAAFERGLAEAKRIGGHSAELMHHAAARLQEDLAHASERMGPAWERFSERGAGLFAVWKDRGRAFLERTSAAAGDWLQQRESRGRKH